MPVSEFIAHLVPYALSSIVITIYLQRYYSSKVEYGIPFSSMFLEKASFWIFTQSLWYSLTGKKVYYLPTPKGGEHTTSLKLLIPHFLAIVLSAAAIIFALLTYYRFDQGTILMMLFAGLNIITLTPSILWALFPGIREQ